MIEVSLVMVFMIHFSQIKNRSNNGPIITQHAAMIAPHSIPYAPSAEKKALTPILTRYLDSDFNINDGQT